MWELYCRSLCGIFWKSMWELYWQLGASKRLEPQGAPRTIIKSKTGCRLDKMSEKMRVLRAGICFTAR